VTIYNDLGDWGIWYIQCDPTTSAWGDDRLGSEILAPGDEFTFYVAPGAYDIRCEDEDGDTYTSGESTSPRPVTTGPSPWTRWTSFPAGGRKPPLFLLPEENLKTTATFLLCLALTGCDVTVGATAPVTIQNGLGGWSIHYVQFSRPGDKGWSDDMLGPTEIIRPGPSGCSTSSRDPPASG
jgi:hypothetical protein